MKLAALGEFGLIDRIAARTGRGSGVRLGIGDDCAVLDPGVGVGFLVTTDMLVEGVHFDLSFTDPNRLGRKALAVNLSDLAAMGGKPRHLLLSLAMPRELPVEFVDAFCDGLLGVANEFGASLVGGDTCASLERLVISITAMGEQRPELVVRRSGACPGDLVFVTGTLGDAAVGLALLRAGEREGWSVTRHLDPTPRVREGMRLAEAGLATAMLDVSDGLLADLGHILRQSRCGARIDLARLPVAPPSWQEAGRLGGDPWRFPLAGGEDYELLFTVSPHRAGEVMRLFSGGETTATMIGEIVEGSGISVIAPDGGAYPVAEAGYNHFAPTSS